MIDFEIFTAAYFGWEMSMNNLQLVHESSTVFPKSQIVKSVELFLSKFSCEGVDLGLASGSQLDPAKPLKVSIIEIHLQSGYNL